MQSSNSQNNNNIEKLEKNQCCGCSSCKQKCPKDAIQMVENEEGFLYPVIDKEKCINCGLCIKACPQFKNIESLDEKYPKAFAMRNKNKNELANSSSGGIFSVLADYVIDSNGEVFGAAYGDNFSVNHIKVSKKDELNILRGSKYVQSNINNTYKEAEQALKEEKKVLFSGTPCQIAGLKSYLGKDYDNLLTVDIVCHGVPSQKLFKKYIEYLSDKFNSSVVEYNFRSKEKHGWGLVSKIKTEDGKIRFREPDFDPYYSNFLDSTIYRENCYKCHYTNYDRVADITLADYWGINDLQPDFFKEEGNSLILINSKKGEEILEQVKNNIELVNTDLEKAARYNMNLKEPSKRPAVRDEIYDNIDKKSAKDYIKSELKYKITLKKIARTIIPIPIKKFLKNMKGLFK